MRLRFVVLAGLLLLGPASYASITIVVTPPPPVPPISVPVPPMGWNGWFTFGDTSNDNETNIKTITDYMLSSGLSAKGWTLIGIDEGWSTGLRDGVTGEPQWDVTRFPSGMKSLATYIHSKGLLAGIYGDAGLTRGCGLLASYGHFANDFDWFFSASKWNYDMAKMDTGGWRNPACTFVTGLNPYNNGLDPAAATATMSAALLATVPRPVILEGPTDSYENSLSWLFNPLNANLTSWYASSDFPAGPVCNEDYVTMAGKFWTPMWHPGSVRPGHFPHTDMWVANHTLLTQVQIDAAFFSKAILSAQFMIGCDPRPTGSGGNMTAGDLLLMNNSEIIAIDQDPAVNPALFVGGFPATQFDTGALRVYKYLATPGQRAVLLWNQGPGTITISFNNADIGLTGTFDVRDTYTQANVATGVTTYTSPGIANGAAMLLKVSNGTDTWTNSYKQIAGPATATGGFAADFNNNDGFPRSTGHAIDTSGCGSACAPSTIYQSARIGQPLNMGVCGGPTDGGVNLGGASDFTHWCAGGPGIEYPFIVQPNHTYRVVLHFCEFQKTAANQRKFNIIINGAQVATDVDVFAEAGAEFKALVKSYTVFINRPEFSVVVGPGSEDQAMISGIEVTQL